VRFASIVVLLAARSALAEPPPPADLTKEFQDGVDAFRLGKYAVARIHLEKARAIDPKLPGPHRFLAAVAKAESKWQECIDDARKALELNPTSVETLDTRKLHDDCRVSAGRAPYRGADLADSAAVAVTSNAAGATVKINGLTYGGTPMAPRPITAGKLEVDVEKRGWKPRHVEIDAPVGIVTDVDVELEADTTQQNASELGAKGTDKPTKGWLVLPGERIEMEPGTHVVERSAPGADVWRRRVRIVAGQDTKIEPQFVNTDERVSKERIGFYALAGGGVLLATGFGFALASEHAANDAREIARVEVARDPTQPLSVTGAVEPVRSRANFDAAVDRANRDGLISDVAIGAGIVAAGVGVYYLYIGAKERSDVPPPFAIAPTRGGAFIAKEIAW
jgi:hypothetical protein